MRAPLNIPVDGHSVNDCSNWRLKCTDGGRHTWYYVSDEEAVTWPQSTLDKYWLGLPTVRVVSILGLSFSYVNTSQGLPSLPQAKDAMSAARNGFTFYKHLQDPDGHWPGEYGGPLFLLPGLVIGSYVSGMGFTEAQRMEMVRYLFKRAHPVDGGWGM